MKRLIALTVLVAVLALWIVLTGHGARAAAARPSRPAICNDDITLRGVILRADRIKGKWLAHAELAFKVHCVPKAGEFDMRLQEFRPRDDDWLTKGPAVKKNVADTTPGEVFTMRIVRECAGDLSWRIRLFISPGVADNGTITQPETFYFPHKAGRQLECDAT